MSRAKVPHAGAAVTRATRRGLERRDTAAGRFVRFPNVTLDALCSARLDGRHLRVALALVRFTYGFNKAAGDRIGATQLGRATGIDAAKVRGIVRDLVALGIVDASPAPRGRTRSLAIADPTRWNVTRIDAATPVRARTGVGDQEPGPRKGRVTRPAGGLPSQGPGGGPRTDRGAARVGTGSKDILQRHSSKDIGTASGVRRTAAIASAADADECMRTRAGWREQSRTRQPQNAGALAAPILAALDPGDEEPSVDAKLELWREQTGDTSERVVALRWLLERIPWREVQLHAIDATKGRRDATKPPGNVPPFAYTLLKEHGERRGVWPMPRRRGRA